MRKLACLLLVLMVFNASSVRAGGDRPTDAAVEHYFLELIGLVDATTELSKEFDTTQNSLWKATQGEQLGAEIIGAIFAEIDTQRRASVALSDRVSLLRFSMVERPETTAITGSMDNLVASLAQVVRQYPEMLEQAAISLRSGDRETARKILLTSADWFIELGGKAAALSRHAATLVPPSQPERGLQLCRAEVAEYLTVAASALNRGAEEPTHNFAETELQLGRFLENFDSAVVQAEAATEALEAQSRIAQSDPRSVKVSEALGALVSSYQEAVSIDREELALLKEFHSRLSPKVLQSGWAAFRSLNSRIDELEKKHRQLTEERSALWRAVSEAINAAP